ncbi:hypothetical protein BESB_049570 [Besnoitia besnoiti]|uniref:Uncharacterized protein n=1 Tax=Besnoitia besnoiti TaxID=94643 RepID=A0A2A9MFK1_BESBE|nr:hypothetical protein BESB_049570 [Besnoitia besnoiti]PFH36765.1 hypothetical protein BESB_049570 [Besnoitia besnoiti]
MAVSASTAVPESPVPEGGSGRFLFSASRAFAPGARRHLAGTLEAPARRVFSASAAHRRGDWRSDERTQSQLTFSPSFPRRLVSANPPSSSPPYSWGSLSLRRGPALDSLQQKTGSQDSAAADDSGWEEDTGAASASAVQRPFPEAREGKGSPPNAASSSTRLLEPLESTASPQPLSSAAAASRPVLRFSANVLSPAVSQRHLGEIAADSPRLPARGNGEAAEGCLLPRSLSANLEEARGGRRSAEGCWSFGSRSTPSSERRAKSVSMENLTKWAPRAAAFNVCAPDISASEAGARTLANLLDSASSSPESETRQPRLYASPSPRETHWYGWEETARRERSDVISSHAAEGPRKGLRNDFVSAATHASGLSVANGRHPLTGGEQEGEYAELNGAEGQCGNRRDEDAETKCRGCAEGEAAPADTCELADEAASRMQPESSEGTRSSAERANATQCRTRMHSHQRSHAEDEESGKDPAAPVGEGEESRRLRAAGADPGASFRGGPACDPTYRRDYHVPPPSAASAGQRSPHFFFLAQVSSQTILQTKAALSRVKGLPGRSRAELLDAAYLRGLAGAAEEAPCPEGSRAGQAPPLALTDISAVIANSLAACAFAEENSRASAALLERAGPLIDRSPCAALPALPGADEDAAVSTGSPGGGAKLRLQTETCASPRKEGRAAEATEERRDAKAPAEAAGLRAWQQRDDYGVSREGNERDAHEGEAAERGERNGALEEGAALGVEVPLAGATVEDVGEVAGATEWISPYEDTKTTAVSARVAWRVTTPARKGGRSDEDASCEDAVTPTMFSSMGTAPRTYPSLCLRSLRHRAWTPRCTYTCALPSAFLHGSRMSASFWLSAALAESADELRGGRSAEEKEQESFARQWLAPGLRDFAGVLREELQSSDDEETDGEDQPYAVWGEEVERENGMGYLSSARSRAGNSREETGRTRIRPARKTKRRQQRVYIQSLGEGLDALEDLVHHSKLLAFKFLHSALVAQPLASLPSPEQPRPVCNRQSRQCRAAPLSMSSFPLREDSCERPPGFLPFSPCSAGTPKDAQPHAAESNGFAHAGTAGSCRVETGWNPSMQRTEASDSPALPTLLSGAWITAGRAADASTGDARGARRKIQDEKGSCSKKSESDSAAAAAARRLAGDEDGVPRGQRRATWPFGLTLVAASPSEKETDEVEAAEKRAGASVGFAVQSMADFYLSVAYLLGQVLKREQGEKEFYKTEVALVRERFQDLEARAKEAMAEAAKRVEEEESQSKQLTEQLAMKRAELRQALEKQEALRRTLHETQREQRLQHEGEVDALNKQYASLLRDYQRRGSQLERLQAQLRGAPLQSRQLEREPSLSQWNRSEHASKDSALNKSDTASGRLSAGVGELLGSCDARLVSSLSTPVFSDFKLRRRRRSLCADEEVFSTRGLVGGWSRDRAGDGMGLRESRHSKGVDFAHWALSRSDSGASGYTLKSKGLFMTSRRSLILAAASRGARPLSPRGPSPSREALDRLVKENCDEDPSSGERGRAGTSASAASVGGICGTTRGCLLREDGDAQTRERAGLLARLTDRSRGATDIQKQQSLQEELLGALPLDQQQGAAMLLVKSHVPAGAPGDGREDGRDDFHDPLLLMVPPKACPACLILPAASTGEPKIEGSSGLEEAEIGETAAGTMAYQCQEQGVQLVPAEQRSRRSFPRVRAAFLLLLFLIIDHAFLGGWMSGALLRFGEWSVLLAFSGTQELQQVARQQDLGERYAVPLLRVVEAFLLFLLALLRACVAPGEEALLLPYTEMLADQFSAVPEGTRNPSYEARVPQSIFGIFSAPAETSPVGYPLGRH